MKNLRGSIQIWEERLEENWIALPRIRQRKIILYFFLGYALITAAVIVQVWYEARKPEKDIQIEHINPLPKKKESATTEAKTKELIISKNKENE